MTKNNPERGKTSLFVQLRRCREQNGENGTNVFSNLLDCKQKGEDYA